MDLSQQKLAEQVGISTNHLQLLESGLSDRKKHTPANPRLSTLIALSTALGVPLPELISQIQLEASSVDRGGGKHTPST